MFQVPPLLFSAILGFFSYTLKIQCQITKLELHFHLKNHSTQESYFLAFPFSTPFDLIIFYSSVALSISGFSQLTTYRPQIHSIMTTCITSIESTPTLTIYYKDQNLSQHPLFAAQFETDFDSIPVSLQVKENLRNDLKQKIIQSKPTADSLIQLVNNFKVPMGLSKTVTFKGKIPQFLRTFNKQMLLGVFLDDFEKEPSKLVFLDSKSLNILDSFCLKSCSLFTQPVLSHSKHHLAVANKKNSAIDVYSIIERKHIGTYSCFPIKSVCFSNNSKYIAIGSFSRIEIINFPSLKLYKSIQLFDCHNITRISFSGDDKYLYVGDFVGISQRINVSTEALSNFLPFQGACIDVLIIDEHTVFTGNNEGQIYKFPNNCQFTLTKNRSINNLCSVDTYLIVSSHDFPKKACIEIFHTGSGKKVFTLSTPPVDTILSLCLIENTLFAAADNGSIYIYTP